MLTIGGGSSDAPTLRIMEMLAVGPGAIASGVAPCIRIWEKLTDITRLFPKVSEISRNTIHIYQNIVILIILRNFGICGRFLSLPEITWIFDCPRNTRIALTIPFTFLINKGVSPISMAFPHRSIAAIQYTPGTIKTRLFRAFRGHCFAHLCNISKFSETLMFTRMRKGAMMAALRSDHPDIKRFNDAKRDRSTSSRFNLPVATYRASIGHLVSIAPIGSISLLANNVSSAKQAVNKVHVGCGNGARRIESG